MFWVGIAETYKQNGLSPDINAWLGYSTIFLYFGGIAVDLFFVLSGYCVHRRGARQLATTPKAKLDLKQYALRRIWRIYPTYVAALCLTALVDFYVRNNFPSAVTTGQDNSIFTFAMSLFGLPGLASPYFGSNGVFWTLALELHFYAIYPILFYVSRKYGAVKALSFAFATSLLYIMADLLFGLSNFFPFRGSGSPIFLPYWFTWTFGFYIAEVEAGRASLPKRFGLISIAGVIIALPAYLLGKHSLAAFCLALPLGNLIYWSVSTFGNSFWNNTLGQLLTRVGFFSYSLYAIHVPVFLLLTVSIFPEGNKSVTLIPALIASLLSLIIAYLFFQTIEKRTLKPIVWVKKN
jgi:peptidoglycan/LPS O-acetylase OafA/YrhL